VRIFLIILGLISIFATCNKKNLYFQLDAKKSFAPTGRKIVGCHWWQVAGPTKIIFDHPDSIVVKLTADKAVGGLYIVCGTVVDNLGVSSDTTFTYILGR
jgi:hypothetical protein